MLESVTVKLKATGPVAVGIPEKIPVVESFIHDGGAGVAFSV